LAKPVPRGYQRATIRYRCAPATVGKVLSADDHEFQRAWILDLSLNGIGFEISRPVEVGHPIIITIRALDGATVHELAARVMHCNPVPQQDDSWYIGCELSVTLSADQLEQLL
jgi:Tfp pilus assembly protein PilZ